MIRNGNNTLTISFQSPVEYARMKSEEQSSSQYPVPPDCVPDEYHGECHANHIRKMQASFSWDWGPAFPSMGVWMPLHLIISDYPWIEYITWTLKEYNMWNWTITIEVLTDGPSCESCYVLIEMPSLGVLESAPIQLKTSFNVTASKAIVELWWPNGYGKQAIYDLNVSIRDMKRDTEVDMKHRKVGFRTIALDQDPLSKGLSFQFRVNGVTMFMKGSNWIPAHVLPQYDEYYYRDLLFSAKEANMNMLRVWGGGIYEFGQFYNLADELGILIWQAKK